MQLLISLICAGFLSAHCYGKSFLKKLNTELEKNSSPSRDFLEKHKENNVHFALDPSKLGKLQMQMSVEMYNKTTAHDFLKGEILAFPTKKSKKKGRFSSEFLSVAKSAIVYKGKSPNYFTYDNLKTDRFLSAAFRGATIERQEDATDSHGQKYLEVRTHLVIEKLGITWEEVKANVSFYSFDSLKSFLETIPSQYHAGWKALKEADLDLTRITTTYSNKNNMDSAYSHGSRTINFYYDIENNNSLHVSYKMTAMDPPRVAKGAIISSQYEGTWLSLNAIRAL